MERKWWRKDDSLLMYLHLASYGDNMLAERPHNDWTISSHSLDEQTFRAACGSRWAMSLLATKNKKQNIVSIVDVLTLLFYTLQIFQCESTTSHHTAMMRYTCVFHLLNMCWSKGKAWLQVSTASTSTQMKISRQHWNIMIVELHINTSIALFLGCL